MEGVFYGYPQGGGILFRGTKIYNIKFGKFKHLKYIIL